MPDTTSSHPDLDRAFEALAHDVMDRTSPPSAGRAIKQARRRRRTAIATVALAAAVVVGGVAVPTVAGGDESLGVTATEGLRALPEPAEFAPEGWDPVSDKESDLSATSSSCLSAFLQQSPSPLQPMATGESVLGRGDDRVLAVFSDFGEDAGGADQAIRTATDLSAACGERTPSARYTDGQVDRYAGASAGVTTDISIARLGNRVAISFVIAKAPSTGDETTAMADSLMAAMQLSWAWRTGGASQPTFGAAVQDVAIDEAFGEWFTNWREARVDGLDPCRAPNWITPASGTGSTPGGGVSMSQYIWPTDDDATAARRTLIASLNECKATQWSVEQVGPDAWVATSDTGSLWITEHGASIALLDARDGVSPPTEVKGDVAALLGGLLEASEQ